MCYARSQKRWSKRGRCIIIRRVIYIFCRIITFYPKDWISFFVRNGTLTDARTCQSFLFTIATNKLPTCFLRERLLCCYFIDSPVNERTDVKRSRSRDRVRLYASQNGYDPYVDISVIRRNTAGPWARFALENTKVFSLMARIVLKDDLRARARASSSPFKREKVKVERSIVLEAFHI